MNEQLSHQEEYDKIINQLSDPGLISDWEKFESLNKRKTFLEKVIEKEREKFSLSVDKKKLAVEDQVETKNISPRGSKKIDSDDSWQFLQGMLKKYPEKSLEYKAIEDEIAKMKK